MKKGKSNLAKILQQVWASMNKPNGKFGLLIVFTLVSVFALVLLMFKKNEHLEIEFHKQVQLNGINKEVLAIVSRVASIESIETCFLESDAKYCNKRIVDIYREVTNSLLKIDSAVVSVKEQLPLAEMALFKEETQHLVAALANLLRKSESDRFSSVDSLEFDKIRQGEASLLFTGQHLATTIERQLTETPQAFVNKNSQRYGVLKLIAFLSFLSLTIVFYFAIKDSLLLRPEAIHNKQGGNYFENILDSMSDAVITVNTESNVTYMNKAAERMTGWTFDHTNPVSLKSIYDVFSQVPGEHVVGVVDRVLKLGLAVPSENCTILKNNKKKEFIIENCALPIKDGNGIVTGAILIFTDVTLKYQLEKKLKSSEKYFRDVIQTLPEALYTCDKEGTIMFYNKAAAELWGQEPVVGKDKWCGSWKIYNSIDSAPVEPAESPMAKVLKEGIPINGKQLSIQRPDGAYREVVPYPRPLFDDDLTIIGAVNMLVNVSGKKAKELAIVESEEKFRIITELSPLSIFVYKKNSFVYANPAALKVSGYNKEDINKLNFLDLVHPADRKTVQERAASRLLGEAVVGTYEFRILDKLGKVKWLEFSGASSKFENEPCVIGIASDISQRKQYEKELEDYKYALDQSSIVAITDRKGKIKYANRKFCEISGYSYDELIDKDHRILNSGYHNKYFFQNLWKTISKGQLWRNDICNKAKDGSLYWVNTTIVPFLDQENQPYQYLVIRNDITRQKLAEENLRQISARLVLATSAANIGVWERNLITNHIIIDENMAKLFNINLDHFDGNRASLLSRVHPEDRKRLMEETALAVSKGEKFTSEFRLIWPDKSLHHLKTHGDVIYDANGKPIKMIGVNWDITSEKTARERYFILAHATSDTIWDWDIYNNRILYNQGITTMFGYPGTLIENGYGWWQNNLHPEDTHRIDALVEKAFSDKIELLEMEYRYRCEDGKYKNVHDRAIILYGSNGKPLRMIGAMQDITYKKEEETRLNKAIIDTQESERQQISMELHDNVNQILSVINTYVGIIKNSYNEEERNKQLLENIQTYMAEAIEEIRRLSSRLSPMGIALIPLRGIIDSLLQSINRSGKYEIDFQFDIQEDQKLGEDLQLNLYRILQEQINNIEKHAEATKIDIWVTVYEGNIRLVVKDNGKGFDRRPKNTGIGFANMKRRAEAFRGVFHYNSNTDMGCVIEVAIPT